MRIPTDEEIDAACKSHKTWCGMVVGLQKVCLDLAAEKPHSRTSSKHIWRPMTFPETTTATQSNKMSKRVYAPDHGAGNSTKPMSVTSKDITLEAKDAAKLVSTKSMEAKELLRPALNKVQPMSQVVWQTEDGKQHKAWVSLMDNGLGIHVVRKFSLDSPSSGRVIETVPMSRVPAGLRKDLEARTKLAIEALQMSQQRKQQQQQATSPASSSPGDKESDVKPKTSRQKRKHAETDDGDKSSEDETKKTKGTSTATTTKKSTSSKSSEASGSKKPRSKKTTSDTDVKESSADKHVKSPPPAKKQRKRPSAMVGEPFSQAGAHFAEAAVPMLTACC